MAADPHGSHPVVPASAVDYNAFVQSIEVVTVRFAKASVVAQAIYIADPSRSLRSVLRHSAQYLNFASGFQATVQFQFRGFWEDEPASGVIAEADVQVLYRSPYPMTDAQFEVFRQRNLPIHAWPYLREFLQSSLARTGWPVYTLPPYKVMPPRADPRPSELAGGGLSE